MGEQRMITWRRFLRQYVEGNAGQPAAFQCRQQRIKIN
jgi:hypothetical protein